METETKVMDLIPENLRETLIQEAAAILKERELSEKTKPASTKELEDVTKHLKI